MGRMYAVTFDGGSILAADTDIDWFEITPADDKPVILHGIHMAQTSDLGDAEEEILVWNVLRGHTTSGSGGVTPTIDLLGLGTQAAGFSAEALNDTVATVATPDELGSFGWNVRMPLDFFWTPETRPVAAQTNTTIVIRQITTAADDMTGVAGTLYIEEA